MKKLSIVALLAAAVAWAMTRGKKREEAHREEVLAGVGATPDTSPSEG